MKLNKVYSTVLAASVITTGFLVVGMPSYVMAANITTESTVTEVPGIVREIKAYDESFLSVTEFAF